MALLNNGILLNDARFCIRQQYQVAGEPRFDSKTGDHERLRTNTYEQKRPFISVFTIAKSVSLPLKTPLTEYVLLY